MNNDNFIALIFYSILASHEWKCVYSLRIWEIILLSQVKIFCTLADISLEFKNVLLVVYQKQCTVGSGSYFK